MPHISPLFPEADVARRVDALAAEIAETVTGEFTVVALLKGSFVFAADLVRALGRKGLAPRIEFMRVSSYGIAKVSSGDVQMIGSMPGGLEGRHVLLVDDIVDSGRSLAFTRDLLLRAGAASLRTCVLLDKPARREVEVPVDWVGFTIEDVFVVGYGIDYAEDYRYLPYIGVVD